MPRKLPIDWVGTDAGTELCSLDSIKPNKVHGQSYAIPMRERHLHQDSLALDDSFTMPKVRLASKQERYVGTWALRRGARRLKSAG